MPEQCRPEMEIAREVVDVRCYTRFDMQCLLAEMRCDVEKDVISEFFRSLFSMILFSSNT